MRLATGEGQLSRSRGSSRAYVHIMCLCVCCMRLYVLWEKLLTLGFPTFISWEQSQEHNLILVPNDASAQWYLNDKDVLHIVILLVGINGIRWDDILRWFWGPLSPALVLCPAIVLYLYEPKGDGFTNTNGSMCSFFCWSKSVLVLLLAIVLYHLYDVDLFLFLTIWTMNLEVKASLFIYINWSNTENMCFNSHSSF